MKAISPLKPTQFLNKEDKEFLTDLIKSGAEKYYKCNKNLSIARAILLSCKELGYSISPTNLACLTHHIKNGKEI